MQTYTFPASALRGIAEPFTIPAKLVGHFIVHRPLSVYGEARARDWRVTHGPTGHSVTLDDFRRRKDAITYAEWLGTLDVDWSCSDAMRVGCDVHPHRPAIRAKAEELSA